MVVQIRKTNGQEAIELANGGTIEFSARSKGAARGFTVDLVVFDEAAFLTDEQMEAITSTMAAAPLGNRQMIFTGTAPSTSMPGDVFGRVRSDALDGSDPRLAWHEWGVEHPPNASSFADLIDALYETNPAMGIRLDEKFTETEYRRMSSDGFARERLGWWMNVTGTSVISTDLWRRTQLEIADAPTKGRIAYGVKFSPDGAAVALAAAIRPDDGPVHVELVEYCSMREGTSWLANWLAERRDVAACAVIDGKASADPLVAQMREMQFSRKAIILPRSQDVVAASSTFLNALYEGSVTHIEQEQLDRAALNSTKRKISTNGGWGWDGIAGTDPTPLEAVTLAYWGVITSKRDVTRKAKVF